MTKKNVLITGAAGFIGSNLSKALLENGNYHLDLVDDLSSGRQEHMMERLGTMKLFFDFSDDCVLDIVRRKEYDIVFHLAATPRVGYSVEHPFETTDNNLNKTVKLLDACKGNIERFIFASSSSVVGNTDVLPTPTNLPKNPRSPYAMQKSHCEDYIKLFCDLYNFDAVSLRFFNVFGPGAYDDSPYAMAVGSWCAKIKKGEPLRSDGDGTQSRDWTYVDNVVQALMKAANYKENLSGKVFNVGCGEKYTNNVILEYLKKEYPNIKIINAPERPGDVKHTCADISETKKILGYNPEINFWSGLHKTLEWWGV